MDFINLNWKLELEAKDGDRGVVDWSEVSASHESQSQGYGRAPSAVPWSLKVTFQTRSFNSDENVTTYIIGITNKMLLDAEEL